ncbi:hypothetical protein [Sinorhizobium psoraleae]|uniref:hypothetical protein n=1 Tax=Sinorhizobium psoraleae TaxID=520838 RepID=UPI001568AE2D|nr:hypothetical protein [Sinorhizobium psoraleae]
MVSRYVNGGYIREADYIPPRRSWQQDYTWTSTQDRCSGRLKLVAYCPHSKVAWMQEWKEVANASLEKSLSKIIADIEHAAIALVSKLEEADRQAEIERQKRAAEWDQYLRRENAKKIEQSVKESRDDLSQIIQRWAQAVAVEQFFKGVEERATSLTGERQEYALERVRKAREFLGSSDPLDFFLEWKSPVERYEPRYPRSGDGETKD